MFAVVIARPDVPLLGFGSLIEFEKLKFMNSKDKINRWLDVILNEDSHRLSDGSIKTIVLIRLELARMQSNEEAVKDVLKCTCVGYHNQEKEWCPVHKTV